MRKLNILLILFSLFLFVTPVYAQTEDRILEYKSEIVVNTDTTIDIVEHITFQPSSYIERHGLEWRVPYIYSVKAFRRPTQLTINKIQYYPLENSSDITLNQYTRSDENGWANVRIGDPDRLITQPHVYIIDYELKYSAISYFDTHDEVYLNIIGPGWNLPIDNASASFVLPTEILEAVCYTGPDGSKKQDCKIEIDGNKLTVKPNSTLQPYEGYTIAIKQPPKTFENTTKQQAISIILANIGILLPIPVGIFLFVFLRKVSRNKKLTVIPQYDPPKDIDVLCSSLIMKNRLLFKVDNIFLKNITALIIEMAIKGYYKIREYKKDKYELVKEQKSYQLEPLHTKSLLDAIFVYGDTVPISKLENFYSLSGKAYSESKLYMEEKGYFSKVRKNTKRILIILSVAILFLLFNSGAGAFFYSLSAIGTYIGILLSSILLFIFSLNIEILSEKGNEMYHYLLGLKLYIDTAEKERIKFHNDPSKYKQVFEELLPYAMIFGLEKKWAAQFEDIYTTSPRWYEGNFTVFNSMLLYNSMTSFTKDVTTTSTRSASSYSSSGGFRSSGWSSGGSGFGGGGSSGGGGGGSGGGGW